MPRPRGKVKKTAVRESRKGTLRLRRLMCGKAKPYRAWNWVDCNLKGRGSASTFEIEVHQLSSGKAEPFRTSGGKATCLADRLRRSKLVRRLNQRAQVPWFHNRVTRVRRDVQLGFGPGAMQIPCA